MPPVGSTRRFWEKRAARLAFQLNVGACLDRLGPLLFGVMSLGSVILYATRRARGPVDWAWMGLALATLCAGLAVWWVARRRFFSATDARVLLESRLKLDTRLTAASAGLVPWPPALEPLPSVVQWRLRGSASWFSSAALLVLLAAWAPVPARSGLAHPTEKPPSLAQTEALLSALSEAKVAEASAIEQLAERAHELANRPTDEQYSHSALEAADALRDQTAAAVAALSRNLTEASHALNSAENDPASKNSTDQLAAALSGLREGSLPANADLMKQLGDKSALKNLTQEQIKALARQLADAAQRAKGVLGAAGAGAKVSRPDPNAKASAQGGPGGLGGGEASAPLALANDASDAGDGKAEALNAASHENLALGDKLGTTSGAHDVDPTKAASPVSAGAIASPAKGGEAVWVNRLTPAERAALKDFYK